MTDSAKDTCLSDLRHRILSLDLEPGAALEEATLTARYGISRTPLREVLQRLAGAGFITLQENRGAKVSSMDVATMRIFFQTAPMVYASIGRLAAENRGAGALDRLKAAQREFTKASAAGDAGQAALANHRFHLCVGEMAQNLYLMAALERLLIDHTRLSQTFYRPTSRQETDLVAQATTHHDAMIAAIAAGEPARMVDLTLEHWDLSRDRVERFVRPDPLPLDPASAKDQAHAI
ncbi:Transcriptional regulator, GntR family [Candidatus Rhodobacter oscarellae]|uniref:Transcriptional regulator, GntR family n=1 Tax=Candidatus Rhodobacter oscarellae TaxID=1675527 RepID=A0A0J9EDC4_9RHOB|nr:GntR family transcriptional regulator [Candidatus Rhodobacter lobularis]KMW60812.1 Transcriptional regulator, GntR family [Candidatus Rhodobacter lobularis]